MFGKNESKSPFIVHKTRTVSNPFASAHGSNNYVAPKKPVIKPVKISESKVYRPEVTSDGIEGD
jgi:hypothetical protein